ncbi:MAG: DNA ligase, partial [Pseudomonadota bacterium]
MLQELLPAAGLVRYTEHVAKAGEALFEQAQALQLEGLIGKHIESPYASGRTAQWRKLTVQHFADCVVLGYTLPDGAQSGFGALLLGQWDSEELRYVGRAGTGFDGRLRDEIWQRLEAAEELGDVPTGVPSGNTRRWRWCDPSLVCEVRYKNYSSEGVLRQPVFIRLRDDKASRECEYPRGEAPTAPEVVTAEDTSPAPSVGPEVQVTNEGKVFWPQDGYTKGQLVAYYDAVAPWMLPYLDDRPLVLTRYPDGIEGKSFFQKDAPAYAPDWLRRETLWSQHAEREVHYFVAESEQALRWIINLGTIPIHIWSSRLAHLAHPDWSIIDLDPKGAPFADVLTIARFLHDLCKDVQ